VAKACLLASLRTALGNNSRLPSWCLDPRPTSSATLPPEALPHPPTPPLLRSVSGRRACALFISS
jgi:hypothetical protein